MTVLYLFVFELNRIRIYLQGVDFERKYKRLQIISTACITMTFIAMAELIIINFNSSLPEKDHFLNTESEMVIRVTSGLEKLIVDIYIYWNLSISIMYLYQ